MLDLDLNAPRNGSRRESQSKHLTRNQLRSGGSQGAPATGRDGPTLCPAIDLLLRKGTAFHRAAPVLGVTVA